MTRARIRELVAEAQAQYEDAKSAMREREPALLEAAAFNRGFQWGTGTPAGYFEPGADPEAQVTYNFVRPTVRTAVASLLRALPDPDTSPSSTGSRALARSRASRRLLRSFVRNGVLSFDALFRGETAAQVHGAAYYKVFWNVDGGRRRRALDENGNLLAVSEGEIAHEFVDIMSALVDPNATSEAEIRYICHRKLIPRATANVRFPRDANGERTEGRFSSYRTDREIADVLHDAIDNDGRRYLGGSSGWKFAGNELVEIIEYWLRPNDEFDQGALIVFSGDVPLSVGPMPCDWPWILRQGQNLPPNALYADGVVRDIIPPQRDINHNASKRREWLEWVLHPHLMVNRGSNVDVGEIDDIAGSIIEVDPGGFLEWLRPPDLPQGMFAYENQAVASMQTISTFSDVSRGQSVPGVDSGRALAYLYEFQEAVHEPDVYQFRLDMARVLKLMLNLARDFYDDGRLVRHIGQNNKWTIETFKRDEHDLEADVVVEAYSGRPNSRALRWAERTELFQMGAFEDTPASKRLLRSLEMDADDVELSAERDAHIDRQLREIRAVSENPAAQIWVLDQDDDELHLEHLRIFIVSQEFDELHPQAQETLLAHYAEHEGALAEKNAALGAEAMMMNGGTAAATGGPPPPKEPGIESPADGGHEPYDTIGGDVAPEPDQRGGA